MESASKRKRSTKGPYKKWSKEEEVKIINYFRENQPFEKPTAQAYYRRYVDESVVDINWKTIRSKVDNMRKAYQNAKAWESSTGAGALNEGETIESVIFKKCPYFNDFEEIFGHRESVLSCFIDTEATDCMDESLDVQNQFQQEYLYEGDEDIFTESASSASQQNFENTASAHESMAGGIEDTPVLARSRKGIYSRTALSDIMQVQTQLIEMKKEKISTENLLREQELELQKEKFAFEKQNRIEERRLKEKEIEVRLLEIQMKERVAIKELELKKQIEIKKLKLRRN